MFPEARTRREGDLASGDATRKLGRPKRRTAVDRKIPTAKIVRGMLDAYWRFHDGAETEICRRTCMETESFISA